MFIKIGLLVFLWIVFIGDLSANTLICGILVSTCLMGTNIPSFIGKKKYYSEYIKKHAND